MQLNAEQKLKPLRRTITPYVGQMVIFALVTAFIEYVGYRTSQRAFMWSPTVLWTFFAALVYLGMRYRVLWNDSCVVMRASGGLERRLGFDEITEIKMKTAHVSEFLAQSRPFRRIVVQGRRRHPDEFIDVSLRHFRPGDIDELLAAIHVHRPDLAVPRIPWGTGSL
ncbi:MAG: hypothetical protein WBQ85_17355 [Candidatus Sulfotelmatobacter sp.]